MENGAEQEGPEPTNEEDVQAGDAPAAAPEPETAAAHPPSRTPFSSLSQVDSDLALARALQEQERAYAILTRNGRGGGDEGSDNGSSEDYEEEEEEGEGEEDDGAEHHHAHDHPVVEDGVGSEEEEEEELAEEEEEEEEEAAEEDGDSETEINPADFDSDEAYARALQEAEGWGIAARLMSLAGLGGWAAVPHVGDDSDDAQDAWGDVDPDEYTYEELVALGEVVGAENRGLSADTIASLPAVNYKAESTQDGNTEQCVICRSDYEDGESLVELSCKHTYHPECINKWLQINKVCPVCKTEVPMTANRRE